jgi:hypothetical protein
MYKAFGPDAFVLGQAMLAFFEASNYVHVAPIVQSQGISQAEPEVWYPQQLWLDVCNAIVSSCDEPALELVTIGMTLVETAVLPPTYWQMPFMHMLSMFGEVYSVVNNRGNDIGSISIEARGFYHVVMHDATPYPDDFVLGAYFATARRYFQDRADFMVYYDPDTLCRDQGGSETLIHIAWSELYGII